MSVRATHRADDPRCAVRGDGWLRTLAAVRGSQDVQPAAHRLPVGPVSMAVNGNGSVPDVDVVVVGAGPVGLTLANVLGLQGSHPGGRERDALIDYPRGVGLDDEAAHLPGHRPGRGGAAAHVPNQILRFFDGRRRLLAEMAPPDARVRLAQAQRLRSAPRRCRTAQGSGPLRACRGGLGAPDDLDNRERRRRHRALGPRGATRQVRARYVVGCDGAAVPHGV